MYENNALEIDTRMNAELRPRRRAVAGPTLADAIRRADSAELERRMHVKRRALAFRSALPRTNST